MSYRTSQLDHNGDELSLEIKVRNDGLELMLLDGEGNLYAEADLSPDQIAVICLYRDEAE